MYVKVKLIQFNSIQKCAYFFRQFGELNMSRVDLRGVSDALREHSKDGTEFKGIKAHFRMDDSGILYLDSVGAVRQLGTKFPGGSILKLFFSNQEKKLMQACS